MPQKTMMEEHLNKMKVRLDNLLASVKEKLLDKERTIGVKPAELVYKDLPKPAPAIQRGSKLPARAIHKRPEPKTLPPGKLAAAFPADDPMAFLLSSGSRKLSRKTRSSACSWRPRCWSAKISGTSGGARGASWTTARCNLCANGQGPSSSAPKKNRTP